MPRSVSPRVAINVLILGVVGLGCDATSDGPSNSATSGAGGSAAGVAESPNGGSANATGGRTDPTGGAGGVTGNAGSPAGGGSPSAGGTSAGRSSTGGSSTGGTGNDRAALLVFSRTVEYRHESIPAGIDALKKLAQEHDFELAATEDASAFTDASLAAYDAVIFLSTTGDVLDDAQQAAFERFIQSGKGFVGIHSATDTEYDWSWYGALVGAYFREHPAVQAADVVVEDATTPATMGLPNPWRRTDEWYAFKANPRPDVQVLLSLDESSYSPGTANMNGDHPIAWRHEYDGGRAFYTALGHTNESFTDAAFLGHLVGGIEWALGR